MTIDFIPPAICLSWSRFFFHSARRTMPSCAFWTIRILGVTFGGVRFRNVI